ncbi:hypothetical protein RF11_06946 [Thelohanellus kitauei]|uniref:Uncharacterized protein n=1 Tax=Thelohanellus kitauei TaxID=669202 RepID=A0A0C2IYL1_THEKT|nr:hypothetical protein RF11_06946 [Thelohanellus kitauei]
MSSKDRHEADRQIEPSKPPVNISAVENYRAPLFQVDITFRYNDGGLYQNTAIKLITTMSTSEPQSTDSQLTNKVVGSIWVFEQRSRCELSSNYWFFISKYTRFCMGSFIKVQPTTPVCNNTGEDIRCACVSVPTNQGREFRQPGFDATTTTADKRVDSFNASSSKGTGSFTWGSDGLLEPKDIDLRNVSKHSEIGKYQDKR